uniref:Putative secreted protein n=1 Tax=Ixodes ricinus TaxID=34613 RepID=A0A6B0UGF1_IXORI
MATSLFLQFWPGSLAYSCSMSLMYCENVTVIFCSKYLERARTKSQAARRRVSMSEPSMSLRTYSSGLSSKSSSSEVRNSMLGMMTFSQIELSTLVSSKSCL